MDQFITSRRDGYELAKNLVAEGFPKEQIVFISNSEKGSFPGFEHVRKVDFFGNPNLLIDTLKRIAKNYLPE